MISVQSIPQFLVLRGFLKPLWKWILPSFFIFCLTAKTPPTDRPTDWERKTPMKCFHLNNGWGFRDGFFFLLRKNRFQEREVCCDRACFRVSFFRSQYMGFLREENGRWSERRVGSKGTRMFKRQNFWPQWHCIWVARFSPFLERAAAMHSLPWKWIREGEAEFFLPLVPERERERDKERYVRLGFKVLALGVYAVAFLLFSIQSIVLLLQIES